MEGKANVSPGLRNLVEIDRLVHEPARLMILMLLYTAESADFTFLVNATELTDGNVSSHLSKLEAAGYVKIEKGYAGKRPRTTLQLTEKGQRAIEDYSNTMQRAMRNLSK
jgi:DNA-binding MarR family transcriptional regulator